MAVTNPFYQNTFNGAAGQIARAESVDAQCGGVQAGFDGTWANLQACLQGQSGEVLNALPSAANRANKNLMFDANGQPIVQFSGLNWRGMWQPSTLYNVGDLVQSGVHQSLWYCTTVHTSGASFNPANWTVFIDLTGVTWFSYRIINTAGTFALTTADAVAVDCTAGAVVLNLPTAPVVGDSPVSVTHIGGSLSGSQTITVSSGSNFIMGNTDNTLSVDVANASMSFFFCGAPYGWRLRTMG